MGKFTSAIDAEFKKIKEAALKYDSSRLIWLLGPGIIILLASGIFNFAYTALFGEAGEGTYFSFAIGVFLLTALTQITVLYFAVAALSLASGILRVDVEHPRNRYLGSFTQSLARASKHSGIVAIICLLSGLLWVGIPFFREQALNRSPLSAILTAQTGWLIFSLVAILIFESLCVMSDALELFPKWTRRCLSFAIPTLIALWVTRSEWFSFRTIFLHIGEPWLVRIIPAELNVSEDEVKSALEQFQFPIPWWVVVAIVASVWAFWLRREIRSTQANELSRNS